jgi:hypothetical protein
MSAEALEVLVSEQTQMPQPCHVSIMCEETHWFHDLEVRGVEAVPRMWPQSAQNYVQSIKHVRVFSDTISTDIMSARQTHVT